MSDFDPGIPVVRCDLLEENQILFIAPAGYGYFRIEPVPDEPRWEAVQIVHEGMADVLDWLRGAGHKIPSWEEQRNRSALWREYAICMEARMSLSVRRPSGDLTKIVGI